MKFIKFVCVIIFQNKILLWKILNIIFHKYPENKHRFGKYLKLLSLTSFFINIRKINAGLENT